MLETLHFNFTPFFVVFARVFGLMVNLPGLRERTIPMRIKMIVAIAIAIALQSIVAPSLAFSQEFLVIVTSELFIGCFLGLCIQIFFLSLSTAGTIMSHSIGFSNAIVSSLMDHDQLSVLTNGMMIAATAFVFILDLHHLILSGIAHSYGMIPLGSFLGFSEHTKIIAQSLSESTLYALKFAMPLFIFGCIVSVGMALTNKLIPQIQIFFLSMPVQIFVGLVLLLFCIKSTYQNFFEYFGLSIRGLLE
jgi:flagellar biosynthetic protein FliR